VDLEGRLSLLKRQAKTAMDQARKSFGFLKKVSSLESQMSVLMAKIVQLEECDAFMTENIESACEQLQCKLLRAPECFLLLLLV
jgi:excinuclease UvrABC nuclease subunit